MALKDTHAYYDEGLKRWLVARPCIEGQDAVKMADNNNSDHKTFLPAFYPPDPDRYKVYLERANYVNYSGNTKEGLAGMIFRIDSVLELPPQLEYLREDYNGAGDTFKDLEKLAIDENLTVSHLGLFVDYPMVVMENGETPSQEDTSLMGNEASINLYQAECIYNWDEDKIGGKKKLTQVRLSEIKEIDVDEFTKRKEMQYRVLSLDERGQYYYKVYDKSQNITAGPIYPTKADGSKFDEIPFQPIGAVDNNIKPDKPILLDINWINIAHYRNSADYEENMHIHGQGTLFVTSDMSWQQFQEANPNGVMVGARAGHFIGANGDAKLVQVDSSQALLESMQSKEVQIVSIGGNILADPNKNLQESYNTAKLRADKSASKLTTLVDNTESGIIQALRWCADFMGANPEDIVYRMNRDFFAESISPQEVMAEIALVDRGVKAIRDVRSRLRDAGNINRTDEEIENDLSMGI